MSAALENNSAALEDIQSQIDEALLELSPKQRRFVQAYGTGAMSQVDAAIHAGYSATVARRNATRVFKATRPIIRLFRQKHELERGEHISSHRAKLHELYDMCADPYAETWEPRTAHSIRRTLLEIDGYIKSDANTAGNVTINIIDPVANISAESNTYEGEAEKVDSEPVSLPNPE